MRTLLALVAFIMFFFSREIALMQEMVFNLRASLHERIMDMAFPSLLLVSFATGIYFLYLIPFPRGWMRWMSILVLCLIHQLGAQNQALFRPRPRHERGDAGGLTRLAKIILYRDDH